MACRCLQVELQTFVATYAEYCYTKPTNVPQSTSGDSLSFMESELLEAAYVLNK